MAKASDATRPAGRGNHFFVWLLTTVLVVAVPLLAVHAWTLYRDIHQIQDAALRDVRAKSASASRTIEATLDGAERLLTYVAAHDEVATLDAARCAEFLLGLEQANPMHAVISVLGLDGRSLCTSLGPAGPHVAGAGGSEWFARASASPGFYLGSAAIGRITHRAVAPLSMEVRDAVGAKVAIAVVSLDLEHVEHSLVDDWQVPGGVLALVNADSRFLIRSPDSAKWLGHSVPATVPSTQADYPYDIIRAVGVDGVERVFASTPVSRYGLRVVASIPVDVVLAVARSEIRRGLIVAGFALLLAGLLAYGGARALARPVRSLAATAKAFAAGERDTPADESLPGEFKALAVEMNSMQAARRQSEANARTSEKRALRLARFYDATSRTNQAIVRLAEAGELFETICEVCVETGQASMSWIGLIEGYRLTPVAWAGAAKRYTQALTLDLGPLASPAGGALGASVLDGEIRIVNDYLQDPRTLPFRANASPFGVRASAIVPFSRGGIVAGTLNLYSGETDFFDEEVVRLLGEMSADIAFALDNFDKAAAHARTQSELAKRASQLSGIVESAMDPIITIDAAQRILVFNSAASRVFGVSAAQASGSYLERFIPARSREAHMHLVAAYAQQSSGLAQPRPLRQLSGLRADGTEFPIEASVSRTGEGADVQMTVVLRDVTGAREAEALRVAAAQFEASNRAKSDFLSRMSHELRTPLNAVLGFSQLLLEAAKEKLNERECRQLDLIFLAGAQLRALVDDVLDVSAIESGRLSLTLRDFDLITLLDEVVRMSETAAREAGIRMISSYPTGGPLRLHTDPVRVRQVLLNLVSNAIKYNLRGGSVTVSARELHGGVQITVADTGMGMTKAQLAGLFEPFNRLGRERSDIEGSGIGMALVRQLVELLGGSISVQSEPGAGTTIGIELLRPKMAAQLMDDADPSILAADPADEIAPSGLVLYIEDNPVNVILVGHILRRWPAVRLVVAEDGDSGIRQAAALVPDIVLLDMQLPDMSGLAVLSALQADAATSGIRVVALSASTLQEDVNTARAAGVQDYWSKPIDVESFCDGMRRLLRATSVH